MPNPRPPKPPAKSPREARLAAALRANLKRRKAAAKSVTGTAGKSATPAKGNDPQA